MTDSLKEPKDCLESITKEAIFTMVLGTLQTDNWSKR
jgi:hypothetical protein